MRRSSGGEEEREEVEEERRESENDEVTPIISLSVQQTETFLQSFYMNTTF